ncbi:HD domain-containing protein [Bradymonas sediminis]|uniref:Uncharacterized protein n=1 Tax=Bradymonas sediminis TaxID=1548548 RepID=A0A2Z4FGR7_9DELT|nr:HD domain-containing protein [Bradymonas sediminis]AWV88090.1 hypothetical protein DN745_01575 [Bradymonas sediminis]TDP77213.1 HD superfamily phosphohydrolase [Bradymonas sediminis]
MPEDTPLEIPHGAATRLPELGGGFEHHGTIRVPEFRNILMSRRVQDVVDHPAFQRLRRVRQLGPTHLVYPGAVHTRFEHSLGVYSCVRMCVSALLRTPAFAESTTEEDLLTVLAAGLLHDIGHYPFAHSLEALHLKGRDTPRHEDVGGRIIRGEFANLFSAAPHGKKGPTIAAILRQQWGVDPERVINLCTGDLGPHATPTDRILRSIISGSIDADKMDYLERDSHHMGVPYGRNYDRGRLLSSLTLNHNEDGIAINAKGKVPAEMFIFGRYTMFSEAYWHHTVRAASAMIEGAMAAFHSRGAVSKDAFLTQLLSHDDDRLLDWIREQTPARSATRYLTAGLTHNRRRLYKRIATFSRVYSEERKQEAYARIYEMDAPDVYALNDRLRVRLSARVGRPLHPADIIIDTPPRDKDKLETIEVVYPGASGRTHYPLHELSRVVAGIQDDFMMVVKKIRIFVEPSVAADLQKEARSDCEKSPVDELLLDEILRP